MNTHIEKAIEIYEKRGVDFPKLLTWHLCHGSVVSDPSFFGMGFPTNSRNLPHPCENHHSDTLFITFFAGDMGKAMRQFEDFYQYICFQRSFRQCGRAKAYKLYPIGDFHNKLNQNHGI